MFSVGCEGKQMDSSHQSSPWIMALFLFHISLFKYLENIHLSKCNVNYLSVLGNFSRNTKKHPQA